MQLSKALLVGLMFSVTSGMEIRMPMRAAPVASPVAVPVPDAPTATLPTPHSHNGGMEKLSCKKLDACLAEHGPEEEGLKTCIMESLGKEKGTKVWAILSKAKLESKKKPSMALLKIAQPSTYTAVVQALFSQSSKVIHMADVCLVDEPKIPKHLRSPLHVPVPKATAVDLPKPPNGHPGTALAKSQSPSNEAPQPVKVPDAPSDCDKGKGLPTPHGHPEAKAKDLKSKHQPPATCQELDTCIAKLDQDQYAVGFKKCVESFCNKLHSDKKFEKKDDPRTAICDKKGTEALDAIAKANSEAKSKKPSFIDVSMVKSLFAEEFPAAKIELACRV